MPIRLHGRHKRTRVQMKGAVSTHTVPAALPRTESIRAFKDVGGGIASTCPCSLVFSSGRNLFTLALYPRCNHFRIPPRRCCFGKMTVAQAASKTQGHGPQSPAVLADRRAGNSFHSERAAFNNSNRLLWSMNRSIWTSRIANWFRTIGYLDSGRCD